MNFKSSVLFTKIMLGTHHTIEKKILLSAVCRLVKIIKYLELLSQEQQNIFILSNDVLEDEDLLYTRSKMFAVKSKKFFFPSKLLVHSQP